MTLLSTKNATNNPQKPVQPMYDCLVIGDVTIDTFLSIDKAHLACDVRGESCEICFEFGAKIPITDSYQSVGGNAANVATALSKLKLHAGLITELGDDLNGHVACEELEAQGVDMTHARKIKHHETRYSMIVNYKSDRTVFSHYAKRSYTLPKLPKTDWVYYTSHGASFPKLQTSLLAYLRNNPKTKLAVNPGSYQIHNGIRTFKKILPFTEVLFVNKEEACLLTGTQQSIKKCAKALYEIGVKTIVITDGENGSYAYNGHHLMHMPMFPIPPISKTGAGDAYASGFLYAYIKQFGMYDAMRFGTANAAGVVQQVGSAAGQCNKSQISALLKKYKKIIPVVTK